MSDQPSTQPDAKLRLRLILGAVKTIHSDASYDLCWPCEDGASPNAVNERVVNLSKAVVDLLELIIEEVP